VQKGNPEPRHTKMCMGGASLTRRQNALRTGLIRESESCAQEDKTWLEVVKRSAVFYNVAFDVSHAYKRQSAVELPRRSFVSVAMRNARTVETMQVSMSKGSGPGEEDWYRALREH